MDIRSLTSFVSPFSFSTDRNDDEKKSTPGPVVIDDPATSFLLGLLPIATDDNVSTDEDTPLFAIDVLSNDSTVDRDMPSIVSIGTNGTIGIVTINGDGTIAYDPNEQFDYLTAGESATDSFTYTIEEDSGQTDTATVTVTILGLNDDPVAADDMVMTDEATSLAVISVLGNDTDVDNGDVPSVTGFDTTGTIGLVTSNMDGTFAYDPNGQFEHLAVGETATDSFSYTVSDGNGGTDTATVTITIHGVNDDPMAADDEISTDEDSVLSTISVLGNDSDVDVSDVLSTISFDTTGTIGLVTSNMDGTFAYDPNDQFEHLAVGETATDSFSYTVSDGNGGTDTATVSITIHGVNDDPMAADDEVSTDEDSVLSTISVLGNDSDVDASDVLSTISFDTTGTIGLVTSNMDGTFAYDPNDQFEHLAVGETATDSFSYTVSDGNGGTDTATVTITIHGVNDDPMAADDEVSTDEDSVLSTISVLGNDSDVDASDVLSTISFDTTGTIGLVTSNMDGTFAYDPNDQFEHLAVGETATDSFSYTVSDGNGGTDTATVTITIHGVNDDPMAADDEVNTDEDTAIATIAILTNDTDTDTSDTLFFSGLDLTGTVGTVTHNGDSTLRYDSNGQFEHLAVGETATDSFTYFIKDGNGGNSSATVTVTILGVNDNPDAVDDTASTTEDMGIASIIVLTNDSDEDLSDTLSVSSFDVTGTIGLVTSNMDGTFAYDTNGQFEHLAEGEMATDSFTYTISDGNGGTDTATVTITIIGVGPDADMNTDPVAADDTAMTDEDTPLASIAVLDNDTDSDPMDMLTVLSFDLSGTTGLVTNNGDGTFAYDPNGQFEHLAVGETATDSFSYTVSDGNGGTDTATVTVTINGANDDPTAGDDTAITDEDTAIAVISVLGNDSDVDASDVLNTISFDTTGTIGLVTSNMDGTFAYDPNGQFDGLMAGQMATDSFSYTVSDGNGGTDIGTVTITITGVDPDMGMNTDPVAIDDMDSTDEDTALSVISVLGNDSDTDAGDVLSVTSFDTTGTVGLVTSNMDGTFAYDPNGQFEHLAVGETATDSFTYTLSDGNGGTDTATVTITINGVNDDPLAAGDMVTTKEDSAIAVIAVLGNDTDPDASDSLTISSFDTTGTLGQVTNNGDGTFSYDPNGQFNDLLGGESATDSFTYTVSDGNGGSSTATVTITIQGKNAGAGGATAGDDVLNGTADPDELLGLDGNDVIDGLGGNDTLLGGLGKDILVGGSGDDSLNGNEKNDILYGDRSGPNENDTGPDGNDYAFGAAGNDTIFGQGGNDTLNGAYGDDSVEGGEGNDSILGDQGEDTLMGGAGRDTIKGGRNDDQISGGDDNDRLLGNNGSDVLRGEDGNDDLFGGFGNDDLLGGAGNDELRGEDLHDLLSGGTGNDTLIGGQGRDTMSGGEDEDFLFGGGGVDLLFGDEGDDTLGGGRGNDTLEGNAGDDVLDGGEGNDVLDGGNGEDMLIASDGDDTLTGNSDTDSFVFNLTVKLVGGVVTSITNESGHTVITDLSRFDMDRIVFHVTFDGTAPGGDLENLLFNEIDDFVSFAGGDFDADGVSDDLNIAFSNGGSITLLDSLNDPITDYEDIDSLNKDGVSANSIQNILGSDSVVEFTFEGDGSSVANSLEEMAVNEFTMTESNISTENKSLDISELEPVTSDEIAV